MSLHHESICHIIDRVSALTGDQRFSLAPFVFEKLPFTATHPWQTSLYTSGCFDMRGESPHVHQNKGGEKGESRRCSKLTTKKKKKSPEIKRKSTVTMSKRPIMATLMLITVVPRLVCPAVFSDNIVQMCVWLWGGFQPARFTLATNFHFQKRSVQRWGDVSDAGPSCALHKEKSRGGVFSTVSQRANKPRSSSKCLLISPFTSGRIEINCPWREAERLRAVRA